MTLAQFLLNLGVSLGLGFVIGVERQFTSHSIGVRTGVLVCMGASLFTSFALCLPDGDVTRMAAQVVSGVGFLGSGIIFKDGFNVRGINTAATIWCTAGIGVLAGTGMHLYALIAAACLTAVNVILRILSHRMDRWWLTDDGGGEFRLNVTCSLENENQVRGELVSLLSDKKTYLLSLGRSRLRARKVRFKTKFIYSGNDYTENNERLVKELLAIYSVDEVEWDVS